MTARTTRWIMVAIAVLSVVVAVAIPGYQTWLVIFGGVLIAWATFGLLTEPSPLERIWNEEAGKGQVSRPSRLPRDPLVQAVSGTNGHQRVTRRGHDKEGVDGSSPSEGLRKGPQARVFSVARWRHIIVPREAAAGSVGEI